MLNKRRISEHINSGMILVEVSVAIVLTTIFVAVIGGIYLSTDGYMLDFQKKNDVKRITDTVYDYMLGQLTYADEVIISYQAPTAERDNYNYICFNTDDGRIYNKILGDMYGDSYYLYGRFNINLQINALK